jgi:hypothetical protein
MLAFLVGWQIGMAISVALLGVMILRLHEKIDKLIRRGK